MYHLISLNEHPSKSNLKVQKGESPCNAKGNSASGTAERLVIPTLATLHERIYLKAKQGFAELKQVTVIHFLVKHHVITQNCLPLLSHPFPKILAHDPKRSYLIRELGLSHKKRYWISVSSGRAKILV